MVHARRVNKVVGMLLAFVMVLSTMFCTGAFAANAAGTNGFQEGTYYGTYSEKVPMTDGAMIEYDIEITFANGAYNYHTTYFIPAFMTEEEALEYSEQGTYTVNGNNLTLSGGKLQSAAVQDDGALSLTGVLADKYNEGAATVSLNQKQSETHEDSVVSGNYVLTENDYPTGEGVAMKMPAYIVIDRENETFIVHPYKDGVADLDTNKGSGTISFDEKTGVYTMTYTEGVKVENATTTFVAAENGITFTSPLYYGIAKINIVDKEGKFLSYTAKLLAEEPAVHEDSVISGNYVLTENDYPTGEGVAMKMPAYIVIDRENETFIVHPYKDGGADLDTNKGSGTISFDEKTGVYTMTYTEGVKNPGCTSTFIAAENGITFTSPLYYGIAKINIVDKEGKFLSYTAKLLAEEPVVHKDTVVSGNYVLTADSYDESAMMKMPAYIVIDRENNTFSIHPYTDGVADLGTNKGSGTISFDEKTGVYTMTYQDGVKNPGCTSTFIAAEDGITFTSPMYYGISKMNTTDEEGNFISYTAKLLNAPVDPENPTDPVNPENPGTTPSGEEGEGTEPNNPSTGDSNHVALLAALLLVSGAGACATLYIRKKTVR